MLTSLVKLELKQFCHHSLDTHHQEREEGLFQWNGWVDMQIDDWCDFGCW